MQQTGDSCAAEMPVPAGTFQRPAEARIAEAASPHEAIVSTLAPRGRSSASVKSARRHPAKRCEASQRNRRGPALGQRRAAIRRARQAAAPVRQAPRLSPATSRHSRTHAASTGGALSASNGKARTRGPFEDAQLFRRSCMCVYYAYACGQAARRPTTIEASPPPQRNDFRVHTHAFKGPVCVYGAFSLPLSACGRSRIRRQRAPRQRAYKWARENDSAVLWQQRLSVSSFCKVSVPVYA